jgi:hypothetical protein
VTLNKVKVGRRNAATVRQGLLGNERIYNHVFE